MVTVRHSLMPATVVPTAAICWRTFPRIGRAEFDDVFVVMIAMQRMQMAVVQIVCMVAVQDSQVSAICAVNVGVIGM